MYNPYYCVPHPPLLLMPMKTLKKTLASQLHAGAALPSVLLAVGMLSGCQLEPTIEFPELPPPPTITFPPAATSKQRPKLAYIVTHKFSIAKDRSIVGGLAVINVQDDDTLPDIARHFGLGYNEITIANPNIRPWTPKAGARAQLPLRFILPDAPRKGIVLNLANMRMFYYPPKQPDAVFTYPIGIGREGWNTPLGQTTIVAKTVNPAWIVPESIRREHAAKGDPLPKVVPPGPDNPLGKYALLLGFTSYLMHGTNKPYGVGMQVSHGCVRLYPEDGTIRHVMSGVNPQGCQVFSFKKPSAEELDHNFLWRYMKSLPERGRIGIFNRSYYEDVLVVKVHKDMLEQQKLPDGKHGKAFWQDCYDDINAFERHLVRSGTVVLKFFLHVSKEEQKQRFMDRLERPEKNWKFSLADLNERGYWDDYVDAYESQIQEFLDTVSMASLAYQEGMIAYLKEGWAGTTEDKQQQIAAYEFKGDSLRSTIGLTLYSEMLLPDTSADILSLLADLDHLLDRMTVHFTLLGIEKPEFPADCHDVIIDFTSHACSAMEHTVVAAPIYFRDPKGVHDLIHKIHYHKQEVEKIAIRLLKSIFDSQAPLERKAHLRDHLLQIDRLAEQADETGDALAIYAVKRSV